MTEFKFFTLDNGKSVPVSPEWHATHIAGQPSLQGKTVVAVDHIRLEILRKSNEFRVRLTPSEIATLRACDAIMNINKTDARLNGRDPHVMFVEGQVALDKIKFTDFEPDTCKCAMQYIWHADHGPNRVHVPHEIFAQCPRHAHLTDVVAHHDECHAENRHKNIKVFELAAELKVPVQEILHEHDHNGVLHLDHPTLQEPRPYPRKG